MMKFKILIIVILIAIIAYGIAVHDRHEPVIDVGSEAPAINLPSKQGLVSLESYRGKKVVLVNFWATWCSTCLREIPSLEAMKKTLEGKAFEILAVSVDEQGWPAIDAFLQRIPMTLPILLDVQGIVSSQYGTYQLPESYLIDRNGKVIKKYIGAINWMDPQILGGIQNAIK